METSYEKVDDTTLKVTKPVEIKMEEKTYDLGFLKNQENEILRQRDEFCEARDKELEEVRSLIKKCEELNIKSKVSEIETPIEL